MHGLPGRSEIFELGAGVLHRTQFQRAPGDGVLHRAGTGFELPPYCRADEIGAVGVEPFADQQVDLTQIHQPQVDGDLFCLLELGHRVHFPSPVRPTVAPSSRMASGWPRDVWASFEGSPCGRRLLKWRWWG